MVVPHLVRVLDQVPDSLILPILLLAKVLEVVMVWASLTLPVQELLQEQVRDKAPVQGPEGLVDKELELVPVQVLVLELLLHKGLELLLGQELGQELALVLVQEGLVLMLEQVQEQGLEQEPELVKLNLLEGQMPLALELVQDKQQAKDKEVPRVLQETQLVQGQVVVLEEHPLKVLVLDQELVKVWVLGQLQAQEPKRDLMNLVLQEVPLVQDQVQAKEM
jgi:hypothetical protein